MTNKERYQRAFSVLHASGETVMEVKTMRKTRKIILPRLAVICAAVVLVLGLASAAYAADIGGIQRTVQIWTHGGQTDAVVAIENGEYTMTYTDEDGKTQMRGGGGVAYDVFGHERPLTEEELMEEALDVLPEVENRDDGSVWVYWYDQKIEITDRFGEDGMCRIMLENDGEVMYLTVNADGNSYSCSAIGYPE